MAYGIRLSTSRCMQYIPLVDNLATRVRISGIEFNNFDRLMFKMFKALNKTQFIFSPTYTQRILDPQQLLTQILYPY